MIAVQAEPTVYLMKWAKSKKLLEQFAEQYNGSKPLGEQLRSAHRKLAEYLLYIYSLRLKRAMSFGEIQKGSVLPTLRTNNEQLAGEMGCSVRTIQNLRERLKTAGFIQKEVWHGTNSSYEIFINVTLIHIEERGDSTNVNFRFDPRFFSGQSSPAGQSSAKTLRHTVSCSTLQDTNKLNQLSGVDFPQSSDNQTDDALKPVGNAEKSVEKPGKFVKNLQDSQAQETNSGYETGRTPTDQAPDCFEDATAGLPASVTEKIARQVDFIMTCAKLNLYADKWISENEEERARARLAEYFIYSDPERFIAGANEIIGRIYLVKKWIERGQAKGQKRWVPIPSIYFDHRNPIGFTRTKSWYKKHLQAKNEIKDNELLTKGLRVYQKSLEDGSTISPTEAYRRISQRLGKRSKTLLNKFNNALNKQYASD